MTAWAQVFDILATAHTARHSHMAQPPQRQPGRHSAAGAARRGARRHRDRRSAEGGQRVRIRRSAPVTWDPRRLRQLGSATRLALKGRVFLDAQRRLQR